MTPTAPPPSWNTSPAPGCSPPADTVDLAHEALISSWPRLRAWIEEDRERLRTHRQLTNAARTWHGLGRDPGALYRGTRLAVAEETFPATDRRAVLTKQEAELLTASTERLRHEHRRRRFFGGVFSLVVVLALLAGGMTWQQNRSSEHRRTGLPPDGSRPWRTPRATPTR